MTKSKQLKFSTTKLEKSREIKGKRENLPQNQVHQWLLQLPILKVFFHKS